MIYFSTSGTPTVRASAADPFRPRLRALYRAARLSPHAFRWTECATDAAPGTIAHRRMLERLLLTHAAGAEAPGWVSAGVRLDLTYIAPQYTPRQVVPAPRQAARLAPGAGARRLDDLQRAGADAGADRLAPHRPGAGAARGGRAILVGDRPGPGWGARMPNWPFVSANRGGCSAWLAEQLEAGGIGEESLYWVNAHAQDGTPLAHGAVEELPLWLGSATLIVALGRHAARWCASGGWGCAEVHHPQYWKRFHARQPYHLIKLLRRHLLG